MDKVESNTDSGSKRRVQCKDILQVFSFYYKKLILNGFKVYSVMKVIVFDIFNKKVNSL